MIGTTLSHYRVLEKLGAGGMGEVYRAEDTTLGRHVAIKVLPDVFHQDPERLARFEREAKVLASLKHPNIAAIHGLEHAAGQRFLVLELVEGETLAQRISRGPLPLEEALEVCRQVAEGLEAAHERGVIHRDLKPANVKVTAEGTVKILDFGLAKVVQEQASGAALQDSPTITDTMTRPGVLLGTPAYMAPEQAKGKSVDKRADVWAFGCVLYECLTGAKAFKGETITEILASVMRSEPDWEALPAMTPGAVKRLLRRCLHKDQRNRLHDIADARLDIQEPEQSPCGPLDRPRWFSPVLLTAASVLILALGLVLGALLMGQYKIGDSRSPLPIVRFPIRLESGDWLDCDRRIGFGWFGSPTRTSLAISGDGRFLVYSAIKANPGPQDEPRLFLRRLGELEGKPIVGADGGSSPFLSPDDRWVGFWLNGKLMKIPVEGGIAEVLCDAPGLYGACWGGEHQIIFASAWDSGLSRFSAADGKIEVLTTPDRSKQEYSHRLPFYLPAGRGILFTIKREPWDPQPHLAVVELPTRKLRVLLENAADARYLRTGHLAFLRQGTLMLIRFDLDKLEISGQPVPVLANVAQALNTGSASADTAAGQYSISGSGCLVYAFGGIFPEPQDSLVWVSHKGEATLAVPFRSWFAGPRLSPDGQRIAYTSWKGSSWIYDMNRGTSTRLTPDGAGGLSPSSTWSSDGQRLLFSWAKTGAANNLYWQAADGGSPMERLTTSDYVQFPGSASPDGKTFTLVELRPEVGWTIQVLNLENREVTSYTDSSSKAMYGEISPDGKWLAYVSDWSGNYEVYVSSFPKPEGRFQISQNGGVAPLWAPDGKQLLYRSGLVGFLAPEVWAAQVETGVTFSAGPPRLLFELPDSGPGMPFRNWDISPDGERFLMVKGESQEPQPVTEFTFVQNWFEEVQRVAPIKK